MWYRAGSVSVTNGSTTVTGSSTNWVDGASVGEGFWGPDNRIYEIASIQSATQITLGTAYQGTTASGQTYQIVPSQSYIKDLAAEVAAMVNTYSTALDNVAIGKFSDGTLAAPGVRFTSDENVGIRRVGPDNLALVTGGADRVSVTNSGTTLTGNATINAGPDSRVLLQVDGTTQAQFQATASAIRLSSNNTTSMVLATNGVDRITLDSVGNTTVGASGASGVFKVQGNNSGDLVVFESTDTSATAAPDFVLYRNSASPAAADQVGNLLFRGKDSGGADQSYARILSTILDPTAGAETGDLRFGVQTTSGFNDLMTLTPTGLGIGTSSPTDKLDVQGNVRIGATKLISSSPSAGNYNLTFQTYSGGFYDRMVLDYAGNLGIGTSLPSSYNGSADKALVVASGGVRPIGLVSNLGSTGIYGSALTFNATISTAALPNTFTVLSGTNQKGGSAISSHYDGSIVFYNYDAGAETGGTRTVNLTDVRRMTLDASGNLGIGTSSPGSFGVLAVDTSKGVTGVTLGDFTTPANDTQLYMRTSGLAKFVTTAGGSFTFGSSGGSERMRLDSSGNLGIGTSSPSLGLDVASGFVWVGTKTASAGAGGNVRYRDDTGTFRWAAGILGSVGETSFGWYDNVANTERMRLDSSGNLGIGTSSPESKLHVVGTDQANNLIVGGASTFYVVPDSVNRYVTLGSSGNLSGGFKFNSGNTEVARIDLSGNLGLGVAPSAWGSGRRAIQISSPAQVASSGITMEVGSNWYNDGTNYRYTVSNTASLYSPSNGAHAWYTSADPTPTAGNAISFTQAMTLDASGNLGVGVTGPAVYTAGSRLLQIDGGANATELKLTNNTTGNAGGDGTLLQLNGLAAYFWNLENSFLSFGTNNIERARITSGGNLDLQKNLGLGGTSATTSGTGITFPATQDASANANTLDDYEEGTWTPTLRGSGTAGNFNEAVRVGSYTKVGNMVTLYCAITCGAITGSPTGNLQITGLPFSVAAGTSGNGAAQIGGVGQSTVQGVSFSTRASANVLYVTYIDGSNNAQVIQASSVSGSAIIDFCISYPVA